MSGDLQKDLDVIEKQKVEKPKKYKVVLLNDDFTPMDFVVNVLKTVFHHSQASATRIMLMVHNQGVGIAGVYTREIAETKLVQVEQYSADAGHPLRADMEPE